MRWIWHVGAAVVVVGLEVAVGCGGGGGGGSSSSSSATSSSASSTSGTGGAASVCVPGLQVACACPGGAQGAQACNADGSGYGACQGCAGLGGAGGAGGSAPGCSVATDCPGTDDACKRRTCTAGACGETFTLHGTEVGAAQVEGDCVDVVCDGHGAQTSVPSLGDVPPDDDCNTGACSPGPVITPRPTGTSCTLADGDAGLDAGTGLCQAGACVAHIPVVCVVPDGGGTWTGCDGANHDLAYEGITFTGPDGYTDCFSNGVDQAVFCPPGAGCIIYFTAKPTLFGTCQ